MRASTPIVVGQAIRAVRRRDVNLNDDQIGCIIQPELLDVFVLNLGLIAVAQVCRESGEAERGNNEYLIGRQSGLVASVRAGRISLTFTIRPLP